MEHQLLAVPDVLSCGSPFRLQAPQGRSSIIPACESTRSLTATAIATSMLPERRAQSGLDTLTSAMLWIRKPDIWAEKTVMRPEASRATFDAQNIKSWPGDPVAQRRSRPHTMRTCGRL